MHKHEKNISYKGVGLGIAKKAMILVHGRGANPESILGLAPHLKVNDFALLAPAAKDRTWYPFSFLAPKAQNEPGLSSGLAVLAATLAEIEEAGISKENIYFLGFSQGACLVSEFLARNAHRYGGAFIYSGGLIGEQIEEENYKGDFGGTPILIGCSDIDAHVPLHRVQDTTRILQQMGAAVNERIYPGAPHTIFEEEIEITNKILTQE